MPKYDDRLKAPPPGGDNRRLKVALAISGLFAAGAAGYIIKDATQERTVAPQEYDTGTDNTIDSDPAQSVNTTQSAMDAGAGADLAPGQAPAPSSPKIDAQFLIGTWSEMKLCGTDSFMRLLPGGKYESFEENGEWFISTEDPTLLHVNGTEELDDNKEEMVPIKPYNFNVYRLTRLGSARMRLVDQEDGETFTMVKREC